MSTPVKKNVSIEYAHIYTNNQIDEELNLSLGILGKIEKELQSKNQTFSLVTLIDDYSFPDASFDYEKFTNYLSSSGFPPDIIVRESQLIPLCDEVIYSLTNHRLKEELLSYIHNLKKYPCSLFIAAWYLLRLGYLEYHMFNPKLYSERLFNILPESFKPYEDKGLEIIAATKFKGAEKLIDYSFFKGRAIE